MQSMKTGGFELAGMAKKRYNELVFKLTKEVIALDSIIEKIKETEAEAEAMKREAAGKAREAIAAAGEEAQQLVAAAREQGFEELIQVKAAAEEQGQKIAEQIRGEKATEADAVCAEARGRMDRAVSYLLERVKQA